FFHESWLVDTPPLQTSRGIEALTVYGRTVAYISGGVVYTQSATSFADVSSTFIECELETQPLYPAGLGGYCMVQDTLITCEFRGACTLTLSASYDVGLTYPYTVSFNITGLTTGATVRRKWALPVDAVSSVTLKATVTNLSGASEGLIINEIDILAQEADGLPELLP